MNLGTPEIILIIILAFLLLGPKRLPDLARSIGESIREFKKSMSATTEERVIDQRDEPQTTPKG